MSDERTGFNDDAGNSRLDDAGPDLEAEALESGWEPKESFKGNPEHWVDAATWVEKGRQLAPLMKAQNKGLRDDLQREKAERAKLEAELRMQAAALKALEDAQHEDAVEAVKDRRAEIKAQIAQASREGEHERLADLYEELAGLKEPAKAAVPTSAAPNAAPVDPAYTEWASRNQWYGADPVKSGLAEGIGRSLAQKGLRGQDFYRELDKELTKFYEPARRPDRQEGSRGGASGAPSGAKGYHDLPAEAKAACDGFADKFVGAKKKYKDVNAWRSAYAKEYFERT